MGARRGSFSAGVSTGVVAGLVLLVALLVGGASSASGQSDTTGPPPSAVNSTLPTSNDQMQVISQVPYYPGGPTFDAYLPKDGEGPRPALIMVHGGGWSGGDMLEFAPFAAQAATDQRWAASTVNYRLDGDDESAWPDELHDVQAAIRFIVSEAATYDIDPEQVLLMGDSAGANLAALISEVGTAAPISGSAVGVDATSGSVADVPIRAVALWSPPVDLADLVGDAGAPPSGCGTDTACDFIWSGPAVVDYLGCPPTACPQTYADASPITWVSPRTLPSYIANSSDELVPVDQVQDYVDVLRKDGVEVTFDELPGSLHATEYGGEVWDPTVNFLSEHLLAASDGDDDGPKDDWTMLAVVVWVFVGVAALLVVGLVIGLVRFVLRRRRRSRA